MNSRLLLLGLLMAALTGCSYRTLMAPCDGNVAPTQLDGNIGTIGSTLTPLKEGLTVSPTAATPNADAPTDCGPLKPVNLQPVSG